MPVISRLVSICLRVGELTLAAVVAGIIGSYLHAFSHSSSWPGARFIYTEIITGISMLLAILWLIPFTHNITHYPTDLLLSLAWFAAFGLLVNYIHGTNCRSSVFNWAGITQGGVCNRWKASEAFSFLSAIFWLASALLGIWLARRTQKAPTVAGADDTVERRKWYQRRSAV